LPTAIKAPPAETLAGLNQHAIVRGSAVIGVDVASVRELDPLKENAILSDS
jgi:hypothetical protein